MALPKPLTVRWCLNQDCSLYGEECYEPVCTRCEQAPTKLTWSLLLCEPRGVYMGLVDWSAAKKLPATLTAYCCRAAVLYRGTGSSGLASKGPGENSRITGATSEKRLANVKELHAVTRDALARWEDEPWSKQ